MRGSYRRFADGHREAARSLRRYLGARFASGFATAQLHHQLGHTTYQKAKDVGSLHKVVTKRYEVQL